MKRKEIVSSVFVILFLVFLAQGTRVIMRAVGTANSQNVSTYSNSQPAVDSWPAFRHDLHHTGYSTSTGPKNNQTLWTYDTGSYTLGGVTSSPAVVDDVVYVGAKNSKVYALNGSTGTPIWTYTTRDGVESSPTVVDGIVFVGSDDHNLYALNASTGAFIWSYTTGGYVISSPAVVDGLVYVGSKDGTVYALDEATGSQVWNYTTDIPLLDSSPAVSDGVVYVGAEDGNVYSLDGLTGARLWSYQTGDSVGSSPAVVDGLVYVGSKDDTVYALDEATGSQVWNYTTGANVDSSPAVYDGMVYVGSDDGRVYALHAPSGICMWTYATGGRIFSSPAVADGLVFIGPSNDTVYALDAATGILVWSYATGNSPAVSHVFSSPAVADGVVYVGAHNGVVYAFGSLVHDVAVSEVKTYETMVGLNCDLNISVTVGNPGDYTETLNVTIYANSTSVASQNVTLSSGNNAVINFTWNTTGFDCGNYSIIAYILPVPDETETYNNILIANSLIHVGIADLAITDLLTLNTIIGQNFSTHVNVTATNQGDYPTISNITVYANQTVIAKFENVPLANGDITLTFMWNTTDFATGNYTMSAHVQPDQYELITTNNNLTSTIPVMIGIPGDLFQPFGVIDMKDIAYVAKRFSIDPSDLLWDANADFDGSEKIDMKDIAVVAKNFGKHDP